MTFAEKLRELRAAKGWSQKQFADTSGFTQAAISRWESGNQSPAFKDVQALCESLGVKCTVFDGCEHVADDEPRGRGRPPKADAEPARETKPTVKGNKPKKKGAK